MWIVLKVLAELAMPPNSLVLLALIGILLRRRHPALGLACGMVAVALTVVLSMPLLGWWLGSRQPQLAYLPPPWPQADAIVVLGGGRRGYAVEYGQELTAGASTLERVRYAAKIARELKKPILVSGGAPLWGATQPEAEFMRDIFSNEYGLPVRWVESHSNDTLENAINSARLLRSDGVQSIYLVTHADHMSRAQDNFEAQGLTVVPLATGFTPFETLSSWYFIPSFEGFAGNRWRLYNLLASLRR
jgi:uncharacterized SAM-binding protein YcdF (DUF218 family)